jgi:hypothetical protein
MLTMTQRRAVGRLLRAVRLLELYGGAEAFELGRAAGRRWAQGRRLVELARLAEIAARDLVAYFYPACDRFPRGGQAAIWHPFVRVWYDLHGHQVRGAPRGERRARAWRWWRRALPWEHRQRQCDGAFLHGWTVGAVDALRSAAAGR